MKSWNRPQVPRLSGTAPLPRIWDSASRSLVTPAEGEVARLYVCGITPYDATHLGHAATYLAFDTLVRAWMDAGLTIEYVQNITDVDDPLLERARDTGVEWRDLAAEQIDLFRSDMEALGVIPPDDYVAVTEVIEEVASAVERMRSGGIAYEIDTPGSAGSDLYFDISRAERDSSWRLGDESNLDRPTMRRLAAERGGDPQRPGKRDPLDPLLWRAAREGEPAWSTVLGDGRPGWHVECSVIAIEHLGATISVQGGGSDLLFPHHEFSAAHATALTGRPFASAFAHAGMIGYHGEKMSKSLGNLVLVSELTAAGVDGRATRLALLAGHYRADREWTDAHLDAAIARLEAWSSWAADADPLADDVDTEVKTDAGVATDARVQTDAGTETGADPLTDAIRAAVTDDLDTPTALARIDQAVRAGTGPTTAALDAIDALLGIDLRRG